MLSANGKLETVATSCIANTHGGCRLIPHWKLRNYMERINVIYKHKRKVKLFNFDTPFKGT